jgi:hypothetical protein
MVGFDIPKIEMAENDDNLHLNFYSSVPSGRPTRLNPDARRTNAASRYRLTRGPAALYSRSTALGTRISSLDWKNSRRWRSECGG